MLAADECESGVGIWVCLCGWWIACVVFVVGRSESWGAQGCEVNLVGNLYYLMQTS